MSEEITFADFQKLDLRVGRIVEATMVNGSEKLVKLLVDLGPAPDPDMAESKNDMRQIVAGIGKEYVLESLVGKQIIVVSNLAPKIMMGETSYGMLLAADVDGRPVLLAPEQEVPEGSVVK